jgi:hypothetical protein
MKARKSWAEKLADDKGLPRVQRGFVAGFRERLFSQFV